MASSHAECRKLRDAAVDGLVGRIVDEGYSVLYAVQRGLQEALTLTEDHDWFGVGCKESPAPSKETHG